jgi:type II secretory pathway pseudopilin PulG
MKNRVSLVQRFIVAAIILIMSTISIPSLPLSTQTPQESSAVAQLRTINTAENTYIGSNQGAYGDIPSLVTQGLLDARFNGSISGYSYTIAVSGNIYTANANAVSANAGRFDFYTTADYVLRYATDPTRAPAGLTGEPVR